MRTIHRALAVLAVLLILYIACTGVFMQLLDLRAVLNDAPAGDPTQQAIRVGIYGPPNFQVIREADFAADPLPPDFNFDAAIGTLTQATRALLGAAPLNFMDLRMIAGKPVGQAASGGRLFSFDPATGGALGEPLPLDLPKMEQPSLRTSIKAWHRIGTTWGWMYSVSIAAGLVLLAMMVTGLVIFFQVWRARRRTGRLNPFWMAGGVWRALHRTLAMVAALFIAVVALSGTFLGVNALSIRINRALHPETRAGLTVDASSPLIDAEVPQLLHTTLSSYRAANPNAPIKVLRLRYFGGMPQGVVITGGADMRQLVFNARSGERVGLAERGYPDTGMPFGWQVGQMVKQIHRGDFFGLSGRWMSLFAGLSLLYLCISGAVIYFDLWNKRRDRGRRELFWS